MKLNKSILFFVLSSLIFIGSYWFSQYEYGKKNKLSVNINYSNPPLLLNDSLVNKLLTQNLPVKFSLQKDSLDLNILEKKMNKIPEVENMEIFLLPQGVISFYITERKPLFKFDSNPSFYSDANGVLFNFNNIDSLPYPEFKTTSSTISLENSALLIKNLIADPFLSEELKSVGLNDNQYQLKLKSFDFKIIFGSAVRIKEKIKKLKVFCAFQKLQDSLSRYKKINLSYNNQVVASTP